MQYHIWSNEHQAWWAPHSRGYTTNRNDAGVYESDHAHQIVQSTTEYQFDDDIPSEALVPVKE